MARRSNPKRERVQLGQYWLWYRSDRDDWCICWLDGRTTRRKSLGIGGGDRNNPPDEAQAALAEFFTANEQPAQHEAPPASVLVEDITRQWLTQHVAHLNDPDRYAYSVLALERFYQHQRRIGKMPDPFTVASVRSWFVNDFIKFRQAEGASAPTISRDLAALRSPINWALGEQILASAPRIKDVPGRNKSRILVFGPEQIAALLEAAVARDDRKHVALYMMIAMSSLGRSEAILELHAETQIQDGCIFFNHPDRTQTQKQRPIVPIAPTLAPWLAGRTGYVIKYESEPREDGTRFVREKIGDIGRAFEACLLDAGAAHPDLGLRESVLDENGNQRILPARKKLGETEGRPQWKGLGTPNTLRHSLHTYLSARGVPKAQIDTAAGHATGTGTGRKYDHLRPDYLREFVAGVEAFWLEVDAFTSVHRIKVTEG